MTQDGLIGGCGRQHSGRAVEVAHQPEGGWQMSCGRAIIADMPLDGMHSDRQRAQSFGAVAELYDRFRSGYPRALIDDLMLASPTKVLDVGCGTGKVASEFVARGVDVLGVDPDNRMVSVARQRGVPVEVDSFEHWKDAGRRFDLIVSGHAWHWVDPGVGVAKAARLLRRGGTIARFWNYHAVDSRLLAEFESIYRDLAPTTHMIGSDPTNLPDAHDPFSDIEGFTAAVHRYRWTKTVTAEQWTGMVGTHGDHLRLERLTQLQDALARAINHGGGMVEVHGGTYLLSALKIR